MFSGKKYLLPNFLEKIHWKITCLAIFEEFSHSPELDNFKSLQAQRVMFSSKKNEKDAISKFFNDFGNIPFLGVVIISLDWYLCYITQMLIFFFSSYFKKYCSGDSQKVLVTWNICPGSFLNIFGAGQDYFFRALPGQCWKFSGELPLLGHLRC